MIYRQLFNYSPWDQFRLPLDFSCAFSGLKGSFFDNVGVNFEKPKCFVHLYYK